MASSNRVSVGPDMPTNAGATAGTENNLPRQGYRKTKQPLVDGPIKGEHGEYKPARYKMKSGTICQDN